MEVDREKKVGRKREIVILEECLVR